MECDDCDYDNLNFNIGSDLSEGNIKLDIVVEKLSTPEVTYNFEVEDFHTYFVGNNAILVHNACAPKTSNELHQFESQRKLEQHFAKHGKEFGDLYQTPNDYLAGANYVIKNGTKVNYMYNGNMTTGYLRFFGSGGGANYAFVGMTQNGNNIATFGIRRVQDLSFVTWLFH